MAAKTECPYYLQQELLNLIKIDIKYIKKLFDEDEKYKNFYHFNSLFYIL